MAVSDYEFDGAGRLVGLEHRSGSDPASGTLIAGYDWTWDQANRLTAMNFLPAVFGDEDVTFSYDLRGQLTGADRSTDDEAYAYDANGNRMLVDGTISYTIGLNNRLESDGTYTYTYDAEGNRKTRTHIATGAKTYYGWDHRNRLVQVDERDSAGALLQRVIHAYDPFNQWVTRTVDPDGEQGSAAIEQTVFVHEGGQIVLQFDGTPDGSGHLAAADLSHRYVWGPAVDQLLADEAVNDVFSAGEVLWPLGDHLGTVRDVVSRDGAGNVHRRKHTQYDSFGNVTDEQHYDSAGTAVADTHAEAIEQLFGYTGAPHDESTGLIQRRARWYDPATGSWPSEDHIWGGYNRYAYVGNTPTMLSDPSGLHYSVLPVYTGPAPGPEPEPLPTAPSLYVTPPRKEHPSIRSCSPEEGRARYFNYLHRKQFTQLLSDKEMDEYDRLMLQVRLDQRARNQTGMGLGGRMLDFFNPGYNGLGTFDDAIIVMAGAAPPTTAGYPTPIVINGRATTTANPIRGWNVGNPIQNLTAAGNLPSWPAVRARFWKNEAHCNPGAYSPQNLARMQQGLAPQAFNLGTGIWESMQLHHNPAQTHGGLFQFLPVTPGQHNALHFYRVP